jgi:hypothetical protein
MTRREFLKSKEMKSVRGNITACAFLGYAIAVASVILNVVKDKNYNVIYDAVFVIVMSVLIHLLQSRVAAILLAVYAVFNIAVLVVMTGKPGGIIVLLIAVYAIIYTFKFHSAWNKQKNSAAVEEAAPEAE